MLPTTLCSASSLAFVVATTGGFLVPSLRFATASVLCDGELDQRGRSAQAAQPLLQPRRRRRALRRRLHALPRCPRLASTSVAARRLPPPFGACRRGCRRWLVGPPTLLRKESLTKHAALCPGWGSANAAPRRAAPRNERYERRRLLLVQRDCQVNDTPANDRTRWGGTRRTRCRRTRSPLPAHSRRCRRTGSHARYWTPPCCAWARCRR